MLRQVSGMDAAAWFARMRSDVRTVDDEIAFERWLAQDPANERAYQELEGTWGDLELFRDSPEIVGARRAAVLESQRSARNFRWSWRGKPSYALAASVAAVAIAVMVFSAQFGAYEDTVHRTAVGARESVKL